MFRAIGKSFAVAVIAVGVASAIAQPTQARANSQPVTSTRHVDLVIALDVSGSMSGLIESAKQRLWDVVNELGRAQPQPELRVAILSYGNPEYGQETGFVKVDQPFTRDLDAVNETLFAFGTNGGDEYVARVVQKSVSTLQWSTQRDALRIIFVAGNEAATQDPQIPIEVATRAALDKGIVVNTLYCGNQGDNIAAGWHKVATLTQGIYASIDQNAAAVANIATPMDAELAALNEELNKTYVAYGRDGKRHRENQLEQDQNAAQMSAPAAASRAVTKASSMYDSAKWDLVDAIEAGKELEELDEEELPAEMQAMDQDARHDYIRKQADKRRELQQQINELAEDRRVYVAEKRKAENESSAKGLDEAIQEGLRQVAEAKGFTFE